MPTFFCEQPESSFEDGGRRAVRRMAIVSIRDPAARVIFQACVTAPNPPHERTAPAACRRAAARRAVAARRSAAAHRDTARWEPPVDPDCPPPPPPVNTCAHGPVRAAASLRALFKAP
jgi:hypothetical protein